MNPYGLQPRVCDYLLNKGNAVFRNGVAFLLMQFENNPLCFICHIKTVFFFALVKLKYPSNTKRPYILQGLSGFVHRPIVKCV
jgi:hypothetical protein